MNPIGTAVLSGYNAIQILSYLKGLSSNLKKKINQAEKLGHKPEEIVNYFYDTAESELSSGYKTSNKIEAQRRADDAEKVKKALGIGVAALGAFALTKGTPTAPSNITPTGAVRPSAIYQGPPPPRQIGAPQQRLGLPAPAQAAGVAQPTPPSPAAPNAPAPQPPSQPIQMGMRPSQSNLPTRETMLQQGFHPKEVDAVIKIKQKAQESEKLWELAKQKRAKAPPENKDFMRIAKVLVQTGTIADQEKFGQFKKYWDATEGQKRLPPVAEFEKFRTLTKGWTEPEAQELAPMQQELPVQEPEEIQPIKLEKKTKIVTPDGDIGEISQISGKNALISTDDGKTNQKLDKLEAITPEVDDVLENYKRLIESIPEEYKSAVVNFIGFDPDRRKLSVRFHSGDQYIYEDLDEEDVTRIAEAFHLAKTSGGNVYGAWSPNDPSRGAGLYKLIQELQKKYGGKGKEYSAKFKTLYDYFALPKQLLEEENKRIRDEKRANKKPKKAKH